MWGVLSELQAGVDKLNAQAAGAEATSEAHLIALRRTLGDAEVRLAQLGGQCERDHSQLLDVGRIVQGLQSVGDQRSEVAPLKADLQEMRSRVERSEAR